MCRGQERVRRTQDFIPLLGSLTALRVMTGSTGLNSATDPGALLPAYETGSGGVDRVLRGGPLDHLVPS